MEYNQLFVFFAGVVLGLFSGLLPGLHPNTISSVIANMDLDPNVISIIIISSFPAHLIASFIPSIFFGVPDASTVVSVLPGHRMVLKGRGLVALKVILLSSCFAVFLTSALFFLSLDIFPILYNAIRGDMKYIILILSLFLLIKSKKPYFSLFIFLISGLLGYYSLNSDIPDPFLPLFSGMFAMGAILNYKKHPIPEQTDGKPGISFLRYSILGVFLGMFADLLPGISSPSQVATFITVFLPMNTLGYLAALGSISISEAIFSLSTSASIGKARLGSTVWLSKFISIEENLLLLLSLFVLSTALSVFIIFKMRRYLAKLACFDFSKLNLILAFYLFSITFLLNGWLGIVIFIIASALGWVTIRLGVERTNLMGAVIVPTLLLLFRINL